MVHGSVVFISGVAVASANFSCGGPATAATNGCGDAQQCCWINQYSGWCSDTGSETCSGAWCNKLSGCPTFQVSMQSQALYATIETEGFCATARTPSGVHPIFTSMNPADLANCKVLCNNNPSCSAYDLSTCQCSLYADARIDRGAADMSCGPVACHVKVRGIDCDGCTCDPTDCSAWDCSRCDVGCSCDGSQKCCGHEQLTDETTVGEIVPLTPHGTFDIMMEHGWCGTIEMSQSVVEGECAYSSDWFEASIKLDGRDGGFAWRVYDDEQCLSANFNRFDWGVCGFLPGTSGPGKGVKFPTMTANLEAHANKTETLMCDGCTCGSTDCSAWDCSRCDVGCSCYGSQKCCGHEYRFSALDGVGLSPTVVMEEEVQTKQCTSGVTCEAGQQCCCNGAHIGYCVAAGMGGSLCAGSTVCPGPDGCCSAEELPVFMV